MEQLTKGNLALERKQKNLIVIEASESPEARKLRVAAYVRVSSDSDDQLNSFSAQMNYYTTLISSKENWTLADVYADEGITGTSAEKRTDFQRLISDCRKGRVDKILVKSISRFARNTKDCLETIRELKAIGIGVCFEEQDIDTSGMNGELLTSMFASLAQAESENISGNMRWSYEKRMQSGTYVPTTLPYGYVLKDNEIVFDEDKAEVIRKIFSEYLAGTNSDAIAAMLQAEDIPCRYGGTGWNSTSIRYILANEKYTGNSLWQKYYTTDTLPYHCLLNQGQKVAYYVENTHPPIISMSEYEAVQLLMSQRGQLIAPVHNTPFPLRKKVYCGNCGTVFRRKAVRKIVNWVCMGHDKRGNEFCKVTQIPEEEIHAAFLRLYHKLKLHGELILTQMLLDLQAVRNRRMLWSIDVIELNQRIAGITDQNRRLAEMNQYGLVDSDIFISKTNKLAEQLRAAKLEKERLIGADNDETIPKTRELLEILETMPEFLPAFDGEIFCELVHKVIAESNDRIAFRLKNSLELAEPIERTMR